MTQPLVIALIVIGAFCTGVALGVALQGVRKPKRRVPPVEMPGVVRIDEWRKCA